MNGVCEMLRFLYYNPSGESRSCVVRTMTRLTGKPYETVKAELTALAAEMGYPEYNEPDVFEAYMAQHGIAKCRRAIRYDGRSLRQRRRPFQLDLF